MTEMKKRKRGRRPLNPDQTAVIQAYKDLSLAHRGHMPTIDPKVYRAANLLLAIFTLEEIAQMISSAFSDPWFVANGTLMTIKSNPDKYRPHTQTNQSEQKSDVPYYAEWTPPWETGRAD